MSMQIRPVYWLLLMVSCLSTFSFACLWQEQVPAQLRVQVIPQERAEDVMVVVHLTDPQDLPLEGGHVVVNATMPSITMPQHFVQAVRHVEAGCYKVLLTLPMTGQWVLTSSAEVSNFVASPQRLLVNIPSFHFLVARSLPLSQVRASDTGSSCNR